MHSEQPTGPWLVQGLDWDSSMLGIPCGFASFTGSPGDAAEFPSRLRDALGEARLQGIRFLTVKLPTQSHLQVNACLAQKGFLADTEVTFSKKPAKGAVPVLANTTIQVERLAQFWDDSFLELADTLQLSRFFRDPHIPAQAARKLWQTSILNSCQGRASYSLVAFVEGKAAAVTNIFERDGVSDIFLIAVRPEFQGMGLGKAMLSRYDAYLPDTVTRQTVETQVGNYPAQALYVRLGYVPVASKHSIHFWL